MVILLFFVPTDAMGILSGKPYSTSGALNLSLVGYDIVIMWLVTASKKRFSIKNISKNDLIVCIGCFSGMIILRMMVDGIGAFSNKMLDNFLLPFMAALFVASYLRKEYVAKLLKVIYLCILVNAGIACAEYVVGRSLFFHSYYLSTVGWYPNIYNSVKWGVPFRCTACLGHPLTNGLYYNLAVVYLYHDERRKTKKGRTLQWLLLTCAIITTNARSALLVFIVYTAIHLLIQKKIKDTVIFISAAIIGFFFVDFQSVYSQLFARDITGSSISVRLIALSSFLKISLKNLLLGVGYNNVTKVTSKFGIGNFEISYFSILLENGLLGFTLWVVSMLSFYKKSMIKKYQNLDIRRIINGMLISYLVIGGMSNSFADPGSLNYILWIILALSRIFDVRNFPLSNSMKIDSIQEN